MRQANNDEAVPNYSPQDSLGFHGVDKWDCFQQRLNHLHRKKTVQKCTESKWRRSKLHRASSNQTREILGSSLTRGGVSLLLVVEGRELDRPEKRTRSQQYAKTKIQTQFIKAITQDLLICYVLMFSFITKAQKKRLSYLAYHHNKALVFYQCRDITILRKKETITW